MASVGPSSRPSRPINHQQWMPFRADMILTLHPGNFPVRPKASVTPRVSGVERLPPEDQALFIQLDYSERALLDTLINAKLRELNGFGVPKVLLAAGRRLLIFSNTYSNNAQRNVARQLGELLEMAYQEILVSVIGPDGESVPGRLQQQQQQQQQQPPPPPVLRSQPL